MLLVNQIFDFWLFEYIIQCEIFPIWYKTMWKISNSYSQNREKTLGLSGIWRGDDLKTIISKSIGISYPGKFRIHASY